MVRETTKGERTRAFPRRIYPHFIERTRRVSIYLGARHRPPFLGRLRVQEPEGSSRSSGSLDPLSKPAFRLSDAALARIHMDVKSTRKAKNQWSADLSLV